MTNDNGKTARHEQLRYEYLLRNLAYLTAREQAEFDYLRRKIEARQVENNYQAPYRSPYQDNRYDNSYGYQTDYDDAADSYYQEEDYWDEDSQYTDQGLPVYVDQEPKRESRKARKAALAASSSGKFKAPKAKKRIRFKTILKWAGVLLLLTLAGMIFMFFKGMNDISSGNNKNYKAAMTEVFCCTPPTCSASTGRSNWANVCARWRACSGSSFATLAPRPTKPHSSSHACMGTAGRWRSPRSS